MISNSPIIQFFYQEGDDPFICGVNGRLTAGDISEIEEERVEDLGDLFTKGNGYYLCYATFNQEQRGEFGRIELPSYWDLDLIEYNPSTKDV